MAFEGFRRRDEEAPNQTGGLRGGTPYWRQRLQSSPGGAKRATQTAARAINGLLACRWWCLVHPLAKVSSACLAIRFWNSSNVSSASNRPRRMVTSNHRRWCGPGRFASCAASSSPHGHGQHVPAVGLTPSGGR